VAADPDDPLSPYRLRLEWMPLRSFFRAGPPLRDEKELNAEEVGRCFPKTRVLDFAGLLETTACTSGGIVVSGGSLPLHESQGHFPVRATSVRIMFKSSGSGPVSGGALAVSFASALLLDDA
jgi:hypothetical protein